MNIKSSNFDKKPRNLKKIKYIVIHYTGMQSEVEAIKRLTNPKSKVSCHYFINKKGKVKKLISERFVAWHAGRSNWKNLNSLNRFSIGIELTNPGHAHKYKKFPAIQISSLIKVLKYLMKKYNVPKKNILGHSDISPLRKKDPGEKFPWQKLAKSNICIWHNLDKKYISEKRKNKISIQEKIDFFKFLKKNWLSVKI